MAERQAGKEQWGEGVEFRQFLTRHGVGLDASLFCSVSSFICTVLTIFRLICLEVVGGWAREGSEGAAGFNGSMRVIQSQSPSKVHEHLSLLMESACVTLFVLYWLLFVSDCTQALALLTMLSSPCTVVTGFRDGCIVGTWPIYKFVLDNSLQEEKVR